MFRPCIDLRGGKVVQIVGGTLDDSTAAGPQVNFVSERPSQWYADLFRRDQLTGGHVIMLGPGNEAAAREALRAWPGGFQVGGGIHLDNAASWLDAGASHVIVTSWVFRNGGLDQERLNDLVTRVGRHRLVLDLSCRKRSGEYWVVTDRWQTFTELAVTRTTAEVLAPSCAEFLVHAVDVEGLCRGVDLELVSRLAEWNLIPITYAGGANSIDDLARVGQLSQERVDLTIGSALDIFGGTAVRYSDCVAFNQAERKIRPNPVGL